MNLLKSKLNSIPNEVKIFILRFSILFILFQIYWNIIELKFRILNKIVTKCVAEYTVEILNFFSHKKVFSSLDTFHTILIDGELKLNPIIRIFSGNKPILHIADSCNGVELIALFSGFILAINFKNFKTKLIFIPIGVFLIFFMNILRCLALIKLQIASNNYFDIYHHYIFKITLYSFIFYLWYIYLNLKVNYNNQ